MYRILSLFKTQGLKAMAPLKGDNEVRDVPVPE